MLASRGVFGSANPQTRTGLHWKKWIEPEPVRAKPGPALSTGCDACPLFKLGPARRSSWAYRKLAGST